MSKKVAILTGHGAGDCCLAFQCASYIKDAEITVYLAVRDEVFAIVNYLFGGLYILIQVETKYADDNAILKDESLYNHLAEGFDEFYYVIPDLLFNGSKYSFDYRKYRTSPQVIKTTRILQHRFFPEKRIYCGLNSTTNGYTYGYIRTFLMDLAYKLPKYEIYYPELTVWNKCLVPAQNLQGLPANVRVDKNPKIEDTLDILFRSEYGVYSDNGPSHFSFLAGQQRLILDPRYNQPPFIARWKEDYSESIPITSSPIEAADIVRLNLELPATAMIDRKFLLGNGGSNWVGALLLKKH